MTAEAPHHEYTSTVNQTLWTLWRAGSLCKTPDRNTAGEPAVPALGGERGRVRLSRKCDHTHRRRVRPGERQHAVQPGPAGVATQAPGRSELEGHDVELAKHRETTHAARRVDVSAQRCEIRPRDRLLLRLPIPIVLFSVARRFATGRFIRARSLRAIDPCFGVFSDTVRLDR